MLPAVSVARTRKVKSPSLSAEMSYDRGLAQDDQSEITLPALCSRRHRRSPRPRSRTTTLGFVSLPSAGLVSIEGAAGALRSRTKLSVTTELVLPAASRARSERVRAVELAQQVVARRARAGAPARDRRRAAVKAALDRCVGVRREVQLGVGSLSGVMGPVTIDGVPGATRSSAVRRRDRLLLPAVSRERTENVGPVGLAGQRVGARAAA